ncbi:hypothetical protein [Sphingopyxis sp. SE2]|uniref:hypothetical protein n=1 Tax=unclassified Sphingopyxis TaxID=2614943 RepID=UPI0028C1F633|nr:hypothetical protein [Sphingopyxis sp. SE2]MDT7529950.1 hypothetical protein [Sphingopyxis sp. SE2]
MSQEYDRQRGLMRLHFRHTIQRSSTPNPMRTAASSTRKGAGFDKMREADRIHTTTGTIALITAERPG